MKNGEVLQLNKKVLFIWGAIFILASGIIYTVQEVLDWYTLIKQEEFDKVQFGYSHDFKVIISFVIIGGILWVLSGLRKEL
jgi:hypothetical protein